MSNKEKKAKKLERETEEVFATPFFVMIRISGGRWMQMQNANDEVMFFKTCREAERVVRDNGFDWTDGSGAEIFELGKGLPVI